LPDFRAGGILQDMTRRFQDVDLLESWAEIPILRRHFYFYLLLFLVTVAASIFQEPPIASRPGVDDAGPPLTATQVYSPPAGQ